VANDSGDGRSTDSELVGRAREGDLSAFHELVDRYARSLFALAVSLSGNMADAEDLVQETFSGAFRGLAAFEGRASVKTWLARILMRQAARHFRHARRRQSTVLPLDAAAGTEAGGASLDAPADARIDVAAAIRSLSAEHQQVIVLRELQGLSYDEMAEVLEIPRGTVESRLFRARQELRERLKDYLG
jgi:RNA polymerase sigma-70 factor (ECF subfamily)